MRRWKKSELSRLDDDEREELLFLERLLDEEGGRIGVERADRLDELRAKAEGS